MFTLGFIELLVPVMKRTILNSTPRSLKKNQSCIFEKYTFSVKNYSRYFDDYFNSQVFKKTLRFILRLMLVYILYSLIEAYLIIIYFMGVETTDMNANDTQNLGIIQIVDSNGTKTVCWPVPMYLRRLKIFCDHFHGNELIGILEYCYIEPKRIYGQPYSNWLLTVC